MATNPKFYEALDKLKDLHDRKNRNYAGDEDPFANFRVCERIACPSCGVKIPAWVGVLIRMTDKEERIRNLLGGIPDLVGEDVTETNIDRVVYGIIFDILYKEWKEGKQT